MRVKIRTGYRCGGARIAVETDDQGASRWLAEFVTPWFEPCPALSSACIRFTVSRAEFEAIERGYAKATTCLVPCFALDRGVVALPGWTEAGITVVADTELGSFYRVSGTAVEVIARPEFPRARIGLMRVVREFLIAAAQSTNRLLDLHAAAFATPAGAVLLVGPKQAGKTTLLTHFLRYGSASLIANDRVLVDVEPQSPIAFGVPTLVSVRVDTLELFPDLRRSPNERPSVLHSGESPGPIIFEPSGTGPSRDFGLSPSQLAQRCGSGTTRCAPLAAIVFPEIDVVSAGWSLEPLAIEVGSMQLLDSLYGVRALQRLRTIFEDMVDRREPQCDNAPAQVARLSAAMPLFRCRLGTDAYRNGPSDLLQALLGERAATEAAR